MRSTSATLTEKHPFVVALLGLLVLLIAGALIGTIVGVAGVRAVEMILGSTDA